LQQLPQFTMVLYTEEFSGLNIATYLAF